LTSITEKKQMSQIIVSQNGNGIVLAAELLICHKKLAEKQ